MSIEQAFDAKGTRNARQHVLKTARFPRPGRKVKFAFRLRRREQIEGRALQETTKIIKRKATSRQTPPPACLPSPLVRHLFSISCICRLVNGLNRCAQVHRKQKGCGVVLSEWVATSSRIVNVPPKLPRVTREGGRVQGWESAC